MAQHGHHMKKMPKRMPPRKMPKGMGRTTRKAATKRKRR